MDIQKSLSRVTEKAWRSLYVARTERLINPDSPIGLLTEERIIHTKIQSVRAVNVVLEVVETSSYASRRGVDWTHSHGNVIDACQALRVKGDVVHNDLWKSVSWSRTADKQKVRLGFPPGGDWTNEIPGSAEYSRVGRRERPFNLYGRLFSPQISSAGDCNLDPFSQFPRRREFKIRALSKRY